MDRLLVVLMSVLLWVKAESQSVQQTGSDQQGVRFVKDLGWRQILDMAKDEGKYIFVDCYATWCEPCKKMEKEVYPLQNVGDYMNEHFISVKLQMDTSKNDDEFIKSWYSEAHNIQQQYKVTVFPSYLFFSPEGKLVHRYLFSLPDTVFLKIAANALNPDKQYCVLLEKYLSGDKDYTKLAYLSTMTKNMGNDSLANQIAKDYLQNYLNKQSETVLYQKKYFEFINSFSSILKSKDKIFSLLYKNGSEINELMRTKKFSEVIIVDIITKEEIDPKIWPNKKPITTAPDWQGLTNTIKKKYNKYYTGLSVVYAQLKWYQQKKDKPQLIKYTVKKFDDYGLDTAGIGWVIINNIAYDLFFKHCNNKDTLNKMIHWMEIVNKNQPDDQANMDTYANLLYKVGRNDEAIKWEEKALRLEETAAKKENRNPDPTYKETLDKMRAGIPTWVKR